MAENDEINIDLDKIKGIFKRKKGKDANEADINRKEMKKEHLPKNEFKVEEVEVADLGEHGDGNEIEKEIDSREDESEWIRVEELKNIGGVKKTGGEEAGIGKKEGKERSDEQKHRGAEEQEHKAAQHVHERMHVHEHRPAEHKQPAGYKLNKETIAEPAKAESAKSKKGDERKKDDDEFAIDFGKIKNIFKGRKAKEGADRPDWEEAERSGVSGKEALLDWRQTIEFFKTNKYAIPVVLILIAIFCSVFFRVYPFSLPITDDWAQRNVYDYYKSQIRDQINQQYPNLPDANKNVMIESNFQEVLKTQKSTVEQQIKGLSEQFKSYMTNESGHTHLLDIDAYYWYAEARNYLRNGQLGDSYDESGDRIFSLRNGRFGRSTTNIPFHPLFIAWMYKIVHFFYDVSFVRIVFLAPVVIIALSIIPAFFIGRRIGGNLGGFFAAMTIAVNPALLSRTAAGVADTDCYNILFPLLIAWVFIESFEAKELKKSIIFAVIGAFLVGLYSTAWLAWWYVFEFIIITVVIYMVCDLAMHFKELKGGIKEYFSVSNVKDSLIFLGVFFLGSGLFVTMFRGFDGFMTIIRGPFTVIRLKDVAVSTMWPNVFTTVAEFNEVSITEVVQHMGGNLLFWLGLMGIVLLLTDFKKFKWRDIGYVLFSAAYYGVMVYKQNSLTEHLVFIVIMSLPIIIGLLKVVLMKEKEIDIKYSLFLVVWFLGTTYAFTKGLRFSILMVPAFAIAFGIIVGVIYNSVSGWLSKEMNINKYISKTVIAIVLCLLLISPIRGADATGRNELPLMNDAWRDVLVNIKESSTDAIITSWWDFGHWFFTVGEQRVTFDGASQGRLIYWVGKSLVTDNEDVAMGILRMLNCGQNYAADTLEKYLNGDSARTVEILNRAILKDRKGAERILMNEGLNNEKTQEILKYTHCGNLLDQYFIASEDMIGKSGVWAHFGTWDFDRADMWQSVNGVDEDEGKQILRKEFNLSEEEADVIYYEIQNNAADRWVSGWPNYMSGISGCSVKDDKATCIVGVEGGTMPLEIDLKNYDASVSGQQGIHPVSIVYMDKGKVKEKKFDGSSLGVSVILIKDGENSYSIVMTAPELANSMFTKLYYFKGEGLEHFKTLISRRHINGGMIYAYKVEWNKGDLDNPAGAVPVGGIKERNDVSGKAESEVSDNKAAAEDNAQEAEAGKEAEKEAGNANEEETETVEEENGGAEDSEAENETEETKEKKEGVEEFEIEV